MGLPRFTALLAWAVVTHVLGIAGAGVVILIYTIVQNTLSRYSCHPDAGACITWTSTPQSYLYMAACAVAVIPLTVLWLKLGGMAGLFPHSTRRRQRP